MYKTSGDRRFQKNKRIIRRAFIDLVMEKGYGRVTITDIAERADINRMTFYSHYDEIEDIFNEFVDDMEAEIMDAIALEDTFSIDSFFRILSDMMYKEIDFFRFVAREENLSSFRDAFKATISQLVRVDLKNDSTYSKEQQLVLSDLTAVCIAYAYLDWLAGEYGQAQLTDVIDITKGILKETLNHVVYVKDAEVSARVIRIKSQIRNQNIV